MKLGPAVVVSALLVAGCSGEEASPTLPQEPEQEQTELSRPGGGVTAGGTGQQSAKLWGMIVEESGACIEGASALVVHGKNAGLVVPQTTPCDAWAYGGGFWLGGDVGEALTIRASAPGYAELERSVAPSIYSYTVELFVLTPLRSK